MKLFRRENSQAQMVEQQQQQQQHQTNLSMPGEPNRDKEYLQELTKLDLDAATKELMTNLLTQDYILSNLQGAELNEIKWLMRNITMKIKRMHPSRESAAIGERRKIIYDDPGDALSPLSPHQENLVDQAVLDFFTRLSRSREGWQQDEISKQVRVSKTEDGSDDSGRLGGLFSK